MHPATPLMFAFEHSDLALAFRPMHLPSQRLLMATVIAALKSLNDKTGPTGAGVAS
jgi:hypothetical protein